MRAGKKGDYVLRKSDIKNLFIYINQLHPDCPVDKLRKLTDAVAELWIESLSGYEIEQLQRAARDHARVCRYWPSLSEIMERLPEVPVGERMRYAPPGRVELEHRRKSVEWQEQWHQELKERGLPNMREAIEAGMSLGQWRRQLEDAGVWK